MSYVQQFKKKTQSRFFSSEFFIVFTALCSAPHSSRMRSYLILSPVLRIFFLTRAAAIEYIFQIRKLTHGEVHLPRVSR